MKCDTDEPDEHQLSKWGYDGVASILATDQHQDHFDPELADGLTTVHGFPLAGLVTDTMKYALGLNPLLSYSPGSNLDASLSPEGYLSMSVNRNPAATDLVLAIEVTGQLGDSSAWGTEDTRLTSTRPACCGHMTTRQSPMPGAVSSD